MTPPAFGPYDLALAAQVYQACHDTPGLRALRLTVDFVSLAVS